MCSFDVRIQTQVWPGWRLLAAPCCWFLRHCELWEQLGGTERRAVCRCWILARSLSLCFSIPPPERELKNVCVSRWERCSRWKWVDLKVRGGRTTSVKHTPVFVLWCRFKILGFLFASFFFIRSAVPPRIFEASFFLFLLVLWPTQSHRNKQRTVHCRTRRKHQNTWFFSSVYLFIHFFTYFFSSKFPLGLRPATVVTCSVTLKSLCASALLAKNFVTHVCEKVQQNLLTNRRCTEGMSCQPW